MNDQNDLPESANENVADDVDNASEEQAAADSSDAPGAEPDAATVVAALQSENADLKDRVLRAVAEMENLRKRTQREVADARNYAIANFARDMLTATDNLERALSTLTDDVRENADKDMKGLIEGLEMTEREMHRLLQKNGVKPILAAGEKFDPHKHQAMFEVPDESVPEGTVVQVMQSGFEIGERVLRPAFVGVAKGGPKAPRTERLEQSDEDAQEHIDKQV